MHLTPDFYFIVAVLVAIISISFPFWFLFGFCEKRDASGYCFQGKRFGIVFLTLLSLSVVSSFLFLKGMEWWSAGASRTAEKAVLKSRTITESSFDALSVMFPDQLSPVTKNCYRTALSHYIDKQWALFYRAESCHATPPLCADSEHDYYQKILTSVAPQTNMMIGLGANGTVLKFEWTVAGDMYTHMRRLFHIQDAEGKSPAPLAPAQIAQFQDTLASCATVDAAPWTDEKQPLLISPSSLQWWK